MKLIISTFLFGERENSRIVIIKGIVVPVSVNVRVYDDNGINSENYDLDIGINSEKYQVDIGSNSESL